MCELNVKNGNGDCATFGHKCDDVKCSAKTKDKNNDEDFFDFGKIRFGRFKGRNWIQAPTFWLEYLLKEECKTSQFNKDIAKRVLQHKKQMKRNEDFDFRRK